jgi:putative phosphoesterase
MELMLIGILSDTHDRFEMAGAAVQLLQSRGASYFIHCGDVGSTRILDHLAGVPAAVVWGNMDFNRPALQQYAEKLGVQFLGAFGELSLDGKRIAVLHGDDAGLRKRLVDQQRHDYILQGHTHEKADRKIGRIRLINPGALHRASVKTVALLETSADRVEFLQVEAPARLSGPRA